MYPITSCDFAPDIMKKTKKNTEHTDLGNFSNNFTSSLTNISSKHPQYGGVLACSSNLSSSSQSPVITQSQTLPSLFYSSLSEMWEPFLCKCRDKSKSAGLHTINCDFFLGLGLTLMMIYIYIYIYI